MKKILLVLYKTQQYINHYMSPITKRIERIKVAIDYTKPINWKKINLIKDQIKEFDSLHSQLKKDLLNKDVNIDEVSSWYYSNREEILKNMFEVYQNLHEREKMVAR